MGSACGMRHGVCVDGALSRQPAMRVAKSQTCPRIDQHALLATARTKKTGWSALMQTTRSYLCSSDWT